MDDALPISPPTVHNSFVAAKCDYFATVHLWPRQAVLDPQRWLANFTTEEEPFAIHLLNSFMYFSSDLVKELFKAAFQRLSRVVSPGDCHYIQAESNWKTFRQNVLVTHVTGETPNETDSGYLFTRMARQELGIPQSNIMSPAKTLEALVADGPKPVLFVDDFVGSGNQFVATWQRDIELSSEEFLSFEQYATLRGSRFFYCPLICTDRGRQRIRQLCPSVHVCPAHFLSARYSALASDSIVWPDHLRPTATEFLRNASLRAGIQDHDWQGFHNLALTLAFEHCVPDATLPLFYHEASGWNPLVKRT